MAEDRRGCKNVPSLGIWSGLMKYKVNDVIYFKEKNWHFTFIHFKEMKSDGRLSNRIMS